MASAGSFPDDDSVSIAIVVWLWCGSGCLLCGSTLLNLSPPVAVCRGLPKRATVLFGRAAGDCPEAEVGKNVTDVNANATEALMNARGIDT